MKRKLVIILTVLALMLSLCSCDVLDDLKSRHVLIEDENTLLYNGAKYLRYEDVGGYFFPYTEGDLNVTQKDVPVLLSEDLSDKGTISMNGDVIEYVGEYYCREDIYQSVTEKATDLKLDRYCYEYSYYNDDDYDSETEQVILTEYQSLIVGSLSRLVAVFGKNVDISDEGYYGKLTLYPCSEDALFRSRTDAVDVIIANDKYYIRAYSGSFMECTCEVPSDYAKYVDEIVRPYMEKNYSFALDDSYEQEII